MAGFGETLCQARTRMGVTLKEAEQATRINRHHLDALEGENFSALPPLIYQRGIVRTYASYLGLDASRLLVIFEETQGAGGQQLPGSMVSSPPIHMPSHWTPNFAIIAFTVVLSAIVFAWVYSAFVAAPDTTVAPTEPAPTATPFETDLAVPTKAPTLTPATTVPTTQPVETTSVDSGSRASNSSDGETSTRGGDNVRDTSTRNNDDLTPVDSAPAETTVDDPVAPPTEVTIDDSNLTSINVTTSTSIWVTVWADEVVMFDGNLEPGESTGHVAGESFRVYTTNGGKTVFTNACGDEYLMGYESGQATYTLTKQPDSCPPVRD